MIKQVFIKKIDDANLFKPNYIQQEKLQKIKFISLNFLKTIFFFSSLSTKTIIYKGLLIPEDIDRFYLDLKNPLFVTKLALVHQRFSTNTFPTWDLAQPFRYMCHNGEINTLKGNISRMKARGTAFTFDQQG